MELTQLRHFMTAARYNSIKAASEELFVTSSALSKSIAKLEDELDVALFDRTSNSLSLNAAGKLVLLYTKNIFDELENMNDQLDIYRTNRRKMQSLVFCSDELSAFRVFGTSFMQNHPDIMITHMLKKDSGKCLECLLNGQADLAFLYDDLPMGIIKEYKEVRYMPFFTDQILLRVPSSHEWAGKNKINIRDLDGKEITVLSDAEHDRTFCEQINHKYNLSIRWKYYSDAFAYQRVLRYNAVPSLSSNIERTQLQDGDSARYLKIGSIKTTVTYYAVYLSGKTEKLSVFFDFIKDYSKVSDIISRSRELE